MQSAFSDALRREVVLAHRDQHKDIAKAARLWGPLWWRVSVWCSVCGFMIDGIEEAPETLSGASQ